MTQLRNLLLFILLIAAQPAFAEDTNSGLFTLSYAEAEVAVGAALADKGIAEKVAAHIYGRSGEALYSFGKPLSAEARIVEFDKATGRWSANLLISAEGKVVSAAPVSGRFEALTEIPVLKRNVKSGAIISSDDIEIKDIPASQMRADTITDMASLIGKSPTYSITAGRPVRSHEISEPTVIKKNALVQMHYRSPGMEITTSGQAMEDGGKGQLINVKNLASQKIIQAQVEDATSVVIATPSHKTMEVSVNPTAGDVYAKN